MKRKNTKPRYLQHMVHHIKLAIWPHRANRHHPHVVRWYGLVLVLLMVGTSQGLYNLWPGGSVLGAHTDISAEQLLAATNTERAKRHLPALADNNALSQAAALKANDMFKRQYWAHVAPDGAEPWQWIEQVGYEYSYAGENLAKNFSSAEATVAAWMMSSEHEANVLGEYYQDVGFAVVEGELNGEITTLVVALYGGHVGGAPVVTAMTPVDRPLTPIARLGIAIQSLTPAALGSIVVLLAVAGVALVAHVYRRKLPKPMQRSWRKHHGAITAGGLLSVCIMLLVLYSGGQI